MNEKMDIAVVTMTGRKVPLQVAHSDTIGQVKARVRQQEGGRSSSILLLLSGKLLEDHQTVDECGVEDEAVLHVLKREGTMPTDTLEQVVAEGVEALREITMPMDPGRLPNSDLHSSVLDSPPTDDAVELHAFPDAPEKLDELPQKDSCSPPYPVSPTGYCNFGRRPLFQSWLPDVRYHTVQDPAGSAAYAPIPPSGLPGLRKPPRARPFGFYGPGPGAYRPRTTMASVKRGKVTIKGKLEYGSWYKTGAPSYQQPWYWRYFSKDVGADGDPKRDVAICRVCGEVIDYSGGEGALRKHAERHAKKGPYPAPPATAPTGRRRPRPVRSGREKHTPLRRPLVGGKVLRGSVAHC